MQWVGVRAGSPGPADGLGRGSHRKALKGDCGFCRNIWGAGNGAWVCMAILNLEMVWETVGKGHWGRLRN